MDQGNYKDPRNDNALVSMGWGESEFDEENYDKRGMAFVTSLDTQVSLSPKPSPYKQVAIEQNEIILLLQEQVDAQENEIGNLKNDKISLEHDLKATETACLCNRDVVNSLKLKSDKLKSELKTLNDKNVLLLEKVETLTSSNIVLNETVFVLTLKVNEISTSDDVKKDLWKRKLVAEKISTEKELFKMFVPSK